MDVVPELLLNVTYVIILPFITHFFFIYTVCSTTLWVGQVDKKATQQDLTNLFEEFGQIESINVRSLSGPIRHYNSNVVLLT